MPATAAPSVTPRSDAAALGDLASRDELSDTDDSAETDFWELAPLPPASDRLSGKSLPDVVHRAMAFLRTSIRRSGTLDRVRHAPDALDESTKAALRIIRNATGAKDPRTYSTSDFHQITGATVLLRAANCMEAAFLAGRWLVEQGAAKDVKLVACIGKDEKSREIDHVMLHLSGWTSNPKTVSPFFFDPFMGLLSDAEQVRYFGKVSTRKSLGNDSVLFPQTPEGARANLQVYAADARGKGYISPYSRAKDFQNVLIGEITRGVDGRAIYNKDPLMFADRRPPPRPVQKALRAAPSPLATTTANASTYEVAKMPEVATAAPVTSTPTPTPPAERGAWPYALIATAGAALAAAAVGYNAFT
jgi:hypothetical protein